jgi:mRNA interferase MazF
MTAQQGELWLVDLGMAAKVRPAVVVSVPADDVDRAVVTIVPHTTRARNSRFEVASTVPVLRQGCSTRSI